MNAREVLNVCFGQSKDERTDPRPTDSKKKRRKSAIGGSTDEDDNDLESFDWWTKYHASVEASNRVSNPNRSTSIAPIVVGQVIQGPI